MKSAVLSASTRGRGPRYPVLLAAAGLLLSDAVGTASAAPPVDSAGGSGPDCTIKGSGIVEKGVAIHSAREGGIPIASFATQEVTLELSDVPADPASGRAKVKTGKGSGSVRIEGWVDASKIPISAKQDLAVVDGHVWIGKGEGVKLKATSPGKLHVETTVAATQQKLKAKASCGTIAIGRTKTDEAEVPKSAKRFVFKQSTLDLYAEANGSTVFTLEVPAAESGLLLFSTEAKGAYTRVQHSGQLVVDAWAKTSDLKPFPKGEMLDALSPSSMVTISPAKLKVDGTTKEVKASKDVPLRLSANAAAKPIGTIEDGAWLIVIDTVAGWSRVFPKNLEIIPPEGKDFWVKAADLGL